MAPVSPQSPKNGPGITLLFAVCIALFIGVPMYTGKGLLPSIWSLLLGTTTSENAVAAGNNLQAQLQQKYFATLDGWATSGGPRERIDSEVVQTCGKLALIYGSAAENVALLADKEELNFRADVCTKMTVNRVYQQPEFQNPEMVSKICDGQQPFFAALCKHVGLR
jgi:predicted NUDIX family NTP pyrophosphohydrolase